MPSLGLWGYPWDRRPRIASRERSASFLALLQGWTGSLRAGSPRKTHRLGLGSLDCCRISSTLSKLLSAQAGFSFSGKKHFFMPSKKPAFCASFFVLWRLVSQVLFLDDHPSNALKLRVSGRLPNNDPFGGCSGEDCPFSLVPTYL